MNKSKGRVVFIIAIILVILLALGGTSAVLYFTTDLFKNEKTLFYKYINESQKIGQILSYSDFYGYNQKKETTPHTFERTISFNESESPSTLNSNNSPINNFKIEINGKNDPINENEFRNIKIKYKDNELFQVSTIRNGDLYGTLLHDIITKYIAIENNNLHEFASKLGIENAENIPDKIQFDKYNDLFSLSEQQKKDILNTYKSVLSNFTEGDYIKQKNVPLLLNNNNINTTTYSLVLTEKQVYNIYKMLLESTQNSEVIINLIREKGRILGYGEKQLNEIVNEFKDYIQKELIEDINLEEKSDKEELRIILYVADKKLLKTEIIIEENEITGIIYESNKLSISVDRKNSSDKALVEVNKNVTGDRLEYEISIDSVVNNDETNMKFKMSKNGSVSASEIIDEKSIEISDKSSTLKINSTNTEKYSDNINIEKLDASNSVTLNNYSAEDIQNLMMAIIQRSQQYFENKANVLSEINKGSSDSVISNILSGYNVSNQSRKTIGNAAEEINTQEVEAFNSMIKPYSGSNIKGSNVKALLSTIKNTNTMYINDLNKQITIKFDKEETANIEKINNIINEIEATANYTVSIEGYSGKGYINKIGIKKEI